MCTCRQRETNIHGYRQGRPNSFWKEMIVTKPVAYKALMRHHIRAKQIAKHLQMARNLDKNNRDVLKVNSLQYESCHKEKGKIN